MNYEIVTDTGGNLTESYIESAGLHILPLTIMVEGEEFHSYSKGEVVDLQQFYTMMRDGKMITTSLPNLKDADQLFREILNNGKDLIYLGFSHSLSGTYDAIEMMLKELATEFPDRKIRCVDTRGASAGQGLLVYHAVAKAKEGMSVDDLAQWVLDNRHKLAHWFTVDDLMFLFRGGRVSKTSAWAGTMLNIKPVLHVDDDGRLIPKEKIRGRKKSLNALVDHMRKGAVRPLVEPIFINHGDCLEDAEYVASLVREEFGDVQIEINYIDPVIGAHSGPGTLALFYLAENRD